MNDRLALIYRACKANMVLAGGERLVLSTDADIEGNTFIGRLVFVAVAKMMRQDKHEVMDFLAMDEEEYAFRIQQYERLTSMMYNRSINGLTKEDQHSKHWKLLKLVMNFVEHHIKEDVVIYNIITGK